MNVRIYIDKSKLAGLVSKAYDLSLPQGLGHLHYVPGPLAQPQLNSIIDRNVDRSFSLDYVNGRAVKLHINYDTEKGQHYVIDTGAWYDHSTSDWNKLKEYM